MTDSKKILTTSFGMPVVDDLNSMTAGPKGPVLVQDVHLLEKLAHFDRERIPERVVHEWAQLLAEQLRRPGS